MTFRCLTCKEERIYYHGRYKDGFTCSEVCDGVHEAKLLKEFQEWLDNGGDVPFGEVTDTKGELD